MLQKLDALIFCDKGLSSPIGKTAHGLIRYSPKYNVVGVIDSTAAGADAGALIDGIPRGIPVFETFERAVNESFPRPEVMVVGLAPTGFGEEADIVEAAKKALQHGISVHSGLHLFLSDIPMLNQIALDNGANVLDIRKPPARRLRMLSGEILRVKAPRLLVTGQDAAVGKRTAAIRICEGLNSAGVRTSLIGTGQTAWLQGVEYGVRLDTLPLDFAGGELEAEIIRAYDEEAPDLILVEGQGSLLNPGYSCETMILLTACRPSMLVYVSAPERSRYIDFPEFPIRSEAEEIRLLETISGAVTAGIIVHCSPSMSSSNYPRQSLDVPLAFGASGDIAPIVNRIIELMRVARSAGSNVDSQ